MDWWPSPFLWEYDGIRTCGTFIVRTCVSKQIPKKWTTLALCDAHVGRLTHGDLWLSLGPSKICHVSLTFKVPTSRVVFLLPLTDNCYLRNLHSPKYSNTIINHHPKSGCELTATNPLTIPELPWLGSVWYAVPGTSHTFSSLMNMIMPCSVDQGSFLAGEPQVQHGNEGNVPPMRSKIHQTSGNNQDLGKNWGISDAGWWCLNVCWCVWWENAELGRTLSQPPAPSECSICPLECSTPLALQNLGSSFFNQNLCSPHTPSSTKK
jgi:hypothetical protein